MRAVVHINKPLSVKRELKVSEKRIDQVQPALEVLTFALDMQTCRQLLKTLIYYRYNARKQTTFVAWDLSCCNIGAALLSDEVYDSKLGGPGSVIGQYTSDNQPCTCGMQGICEYVSCRH